MGPVTRSPYLACMLVLLLSFVAPRVSATEASGEQTARQEFAAGVQAFQDGDYAAALAHFRAADEKSPAPPITYNIARTYESLERPDEAVLSYERYIAEAGETGEFTQAATVAIAQLKARSTRFRIESTPPGATVTVNGRVLPEKTPTSVLVSKGEHTVSVEGEGWSQTRKVEAAGGGSSSLVFVHEQERTPAPSVAPVVVSRPPAEEPAVLDGLTGTLGLSASLYHFAGDAEQQSSTERTTADSQPGGVTFGLAFDAGWAFSARGAMLLRAVSGLGSSENALASIGAAGPVVAFRLGESWWLGGGIVLGAGRADSDATSETEGLVERQDSTITFQTDLAVGPTLELSFVLGESGTGHWLLSLFPSMLLTTTAEQSTVFVPLVVGHRWL